MPDGGAVLDGLRVHTTPLPGLSPARDDSISESVAASLEPLDEVSVVGLGEASHGTREFFQAKRRTIRSLVCDHGFRTVAFEADVGATCAVDDVVRGRGLGREGDTEDALARLGKWMWKTESVLCLLRWLRAFNEGRPPSDRVRVRGIDLSDPSSQATRLRSYLSRVDPAYADTDEVTALVAFDTPADADGRSRRFAAAADAAEAVADRLEARRAEYVAASSESAWETARHLCRTVEWTCEWHRVRFDHDGPHAAGMAERDRRMAENVAWCVDRDPGDGVVVWAHNSHVQRETFDDGQVWTDETTMGGHLADEFGDAYLPVGFDFGRGAVRALDATADSADPGVFSLASPLSGSATARFDSLDAAPCLVDLAGAASDPRLERWLGRPRRVRWIGSVYDPTAEAGHHYLETDLPNAFDALVFVAESTPSRPVADG